MSFFALQLSCGIDRVMRVFLSCVQTRMSVHVALFRCMGCIRCVCQIFLTTKTCFATDRARRLTKWPSNGTSYLFHQISVFNSLLKKCIPTERQVPGKHKNQLLFKAVNNNLMLWFPIFNIYIYIYIIYINIYIYIIYIYKHIYIYI